MRLAALLALTASLQAATVWTVKSSGGTYSLSQLQTAITAADADVTSSRPIIIEIEKGQDAATAGGVIVPGNYDKTVTGAANNGSGLIRITIGAGHNWSTGDTVQITSVGGVSAATGTWTVTRISSTVVDLQGSTFSGTFTSGGTAYRLQRGDCDASPIIIRGSGIADGTLTPNTRVGYVTGAQDTRLGRITNTTSGYVPLTVGHRAACWLFEGLEIPHLAGSSQSTIVLFGDVTGPYGNAILNDQRDQPHDFRFRQVYIHGNQNENGPSIGMYFYGRRLRVTDSTISQIKDYNGPEAKGFLSVISSGDVIFRNNLISASHIGSLFGGAVPGIRALNPEGVFYYGNHYYKPWNWRSTVSTTVPSTCASDANGGEWHQNQTDSTYRECVSGSWVVRTSGQYLAWWLNTQMTAYPNLSIEKNHWEHKIGLRIESEGMVCQNAWMPGAGSQFGTCALLNLVDHGDYSERTGVTHGQGLQIRDVRIRYTKAKKVCYYMSNGQTGFDQAYQRSNIFFENNVTADLGETANCSTPSDASNYYGVGFQTGRSSNMVWANNTLLLNNSTQATRIGSIDNSQTTNAIVNNNVLTYGLYGVRNNYDGSGNSSQGVANAWLPGRSFAKNWFIDDQSQNSVAFNFGTATTEGHAPCFGCTQVASFAAENFNSYPTNLRLTSSSPGYQAGLLGKNAGADIDDVDASTEGTESGAHNPYFDFRIKPVDVTSSTTATIRYNSYGHAACTVLVSPKPDYSSPVYNSADTAGSQERTLNLTGLTAGRTRYYVKITCDGGRKREAIFSMHP